MQSKLLLTVFLAFNLFVFCFTHTQAQIWQSLNGPNESDVVDIVVKNDTVYVASQWGGGLFKRGLDSSQWLYSEIVEGEGAFRNVIAGLLSINMDGQGNYYTGGAGVVNVGNGEAYGHFFISNDYGKTWSELRDGIENYPIINDISIIYEDNILVGGFFRLIKEENRFERTGGNASGITFYEHQDTLLIGTNEGIEYSVDNGINWIEAGTDTLEIQSITFFGNEFFFGTDQGLYSSEILDQPWTSIEQFTHTPINALYHFNNEILIGTESGVFTYSPEKLTVKDVFPDLHGQDVNTFNKFEDTLFIGAGMGLYTCNWEENKCSREGVPDSRISTLTFQNKDTLLAGTSNKIYRYFTDTQQWDGLTIPVERARSIIPIKNDSLYTIRRGFFYKCSFIDSACDSTEIDSGNTLFDLTQNKNKDLFVASAPNVLQSQDNGETWDVIYQNSGNNNRDVFTYSDSLLFINTESGLIKYSLNHSHYKVIGFEGSGINDYYMTRNGIIYVSAFFSVHKSSDFGESWEKILQSSDLMSSDILIDIAYDENNEILYASSTEGRVYISDNDGSNWGINDELYPVYMEAAAIGNDGSLYLGTSSAGVFKNTTPLNPPITISNEEESDSAVPDEFTLHQNYPNPFNPSTTITYSLPASADVRLTVYNLVGQEVLVLLNGTQTQGVHTVQFDAGHLASGLYLYKLETENYSETRKMMLVK